MKYLSVCSGIEAATVAWHHMGWTPAAFSEIEPFPSAVLKHHYPTVPNMGDMTRFQEWNLEPIDLLVGGTPCQSFSVAGLRKGLDDPRGNLMLTYLAIAKLNRPKWLVWENVPGVLSDKTEAFKCLLDGLEELGYIIDCDILDAQFHGVPQRRRRIFVCGQHRDYLLSNKTDSSALTIAQCLLEILRGILVNQSVALGNEPQNSDLAYLSKDGVSRRMKLFGLLGGQDNSATLRENLVAACLKFHQEQNSINVIRGEKERDFTQADLLKDFQMDAQFLPTGQQLKETLEDVFLVMKSFITSTETNSITTSQICLCSKAVLNIAKLISHLNQSSQSFWSAASSALIALEEYTNYARRTSNDLFGDMERVSYWIHFISQAERTSDFISDIGIECFGKIFSVSDSLSGHPAPSRASREGTARGTAPGVDGGGWPADVAPTLNAAFGSKQGLEDQHINGGGGDALCPPISLCLNAGAMRRQDAESETLIPINGGGFDVMKPIGFQISPQCGEFTDVAPTLDCRAKNGPIQNQIGAGVMQPIAIQGTMIGRGENADPQGSGVDERGSMFTLTKTDVHAVAQSAMQVRRLTPIECERLQGFPDGYTNIPWRNKPESPDGPRYKALGNSMAVPVMRWIGERIQQVENING